MRPDQYRVIYRLLVRCRNALDVLITWTRVRAFPESQGMRRKRTAQPSATPPAVAG